MSDIINSKSRSDLTPLSLLPPEKQEKRLKAKRQPKIKATEPVNIFSNGGGYNQRLR